MSRMSYLKELKAALLLAGGTVCVFLTVFYCVIAYAIFIFSFDRLPISHGELSLLVPGTTTQAEAVQKFGKPKYDDWIVRETLGRLLAVETTAKAWTRRRRPPRLLVSSARGPGRRRFGGHGPETPGLTSDCLVSRDFWNKEGRS
jgi:hypothetical protein